MLPLSVLTFMLAFIPMIGAIVAGGFAALVALATGGPGDALLVVLLSLIVNQLEGVLVSPFAVGRAVASTPPPCCSRSWREPIAGIVGAFPAAPTLAVVMTIVRVVGAEPPTRFCEPEAALSLGLSRSASRRSGGCCGRDTLPVLPEGRVEEGRVGQEPGDDEQTRERIDGRRTENAVGIDGSIDLGHEGEVD